MAEFEARIEAYSDELERKVEMHFGEEFQARMDATQSAVETLTLQCRDANLADGETRILESSLDNKQVKIACVKGDKEVLKAKATLDAINTSDKLTAKEKKSFREHSDGDHHIEITRN